MRAAAIVNGNARRLADPVRAALLRALPGAVTFTRSLAEARAAIRAEIARGVDLLVLGGGDGTVVMGLTLIEEACRGTARPAPAIGVLRLGGTNAIAGVVGATGDAASDLARLARGEGAWRVIPMLYVLGVRAPFVAVGAGARARGRADRAVVDRIVDRVPLARRFVGDAARAALSRALGSVPGRAEGPRSRAVIENLGAPAIELARGVPTGRRIASGDAVWSGAHDEIAAATVLSPGLGADPRRHRERFRLSFGSPAGAASTEFLCDHIQIRLEAEAPIEAGGELLGHRSEIDLAIGEPATLVALGGDPR